MHTLALLFSEPLNSRATLIESGQIARNLRTAMGNGFRFLGIDDSLMM